jgi:post-segregation antitoxin (ccd killing protein)
MKKKRVKDAMLSVRVESDHLKILKKNNIDVADLVRVAVAKAAAEISA